MTFVRAREEYASRQVYDTRSQEEQSPSEHGYVYYTFWIVVGVLAFGRLTAAIDKITGIPSDETPTYQQYQPSASTQ